MNIITPVALVKGDSQEYQANGKILRVFDTNGSGELLPVQHRQQSDDSKFTLQHMPFGKIYAEVAR